MSMLILNSLFVYAGWLIFSKTLFGFVDVVQLLLVAEQIGRKLKGRVKMYKNIVLLDNNII